MSAIAFMITITLCEADDPRESQENGAILKDSDKFVNFFSQRDQKPLVGIAIARVYEALLFCNTPMQ